MKIKIYVYISNNDTHLHAIKSQLTSPITGGLGRTHTGMSEFKRKKPKSSLPVLTTITSIENL